MIKKETQDLIAKGAMLPLMEEFYTIIMIVDITNSPKDLREVQEEMNKIADELRIKIYLQHEDLFQAMHRL